LGTAKKGDTIGQYVDPHDGSIGELVLRLPKPEPKKGKSVQAEEKGTASPTPAKTRPAITRKGMAIIGDLRSEALAKALLQNPFDDITLLGLLLLAFNASNVDIKTGDFIRGKQHRLFQAITEGGHLSQDVELLRQSARELLALIFSCRPDYHSSGIAARFAGEAIAADARLPNMASEEFLSCLSKSTLERAATGIGVTPGPRAKDTRAAIIKETAGSTFVLPAARFAPDENELAAHQEPVQSWGEDGEEDREVGETESSGTEDKPSLETEDDLDGGDFPTVEAMPYPNATADLEQPSDS
jgi:ParB family transcriptional regulator, chromosome partitioning protein